MEPPVDFVIITPLAEERDALLDKLENPKRTNPSDEDSRVYYVSQLTATFPDGTPTTYKVVVAPLIGMGRVEAATSTSDAVRKWKPRFVLLVGIAGGYGAAGVRLGDVLIANQIADYEEQKLTEAQAKIRWQVMPVNTRLLAEAQNFRSEGWVQTIAASRPEDGRPKIHFGTMCTGDKVIANSLLSDYQATWPRLIGVEMEAGGTARAAFQAADTPGFLMIRGVSDLADKDKGSEQVEQWRGHGCEVAAAFTVAFLKAGPVTANATEFIQSDIPKSSPQVGPSPQSSSAVDIWKERLEFLQIEEAKIADPAQKFTLKKQIEECLAKIAEFKGQVQTSNAQSLQTPNPEEILDVLTALVSAQFERIVFSFDRGNAVPGKAAAQSERAIELVRLAQSEGDAGLKRLWQTIQRVRG